MRNDSPQRGGGADWPLGPIFAPFLKCFNVSREGRGRGGGCISRPVSTSLSQYLKRGIRSTDLHGIFINSIALYRYRAVFIKKNTLVSESVWHLFAMFYFPWVENGEFGVKSFVKKIPHSRSLVAMSV